MVEEINEKSYYMKNRDKIRNKACRLVQCERCYKIMQFKSIIPHKKTKKCIKDYEKRLNLVIPTLRDDIEII